MILNWEDVLKIVLALAAGGLIGFEREYRDKAAGLRTLILICVGSALFTILSGRLADPPNARIAASIVAGVGFLGAGVILRDEKAGRVMGLTTAALIWVAAALGMALGAGYYLLSALVVVVTMLVLWLFPKLEGLIDRTQGVRMYEVSMRGGGDKYLAIDSKLREQARRVTLTRQVRCRDTMTVTWQVIADGPAHERLREVLLADGELEEVRL